MALKDILTLVITIATFLFTVLIPTIIMLWKVRKAYKTAKTQAEKEAAINDLKALALNFVVEAESLYKDIDAIVKQSGKTCGAVKKDSVMTKIQDACLTKGVAFDKEFWSKEVDDLVAATRKVNAKQ